MPVKTHVDAIRCHAATSSSIVWKTRNQSLYGWCHHHIQPSMANARSSVTPPLPSFAAQMLRQLAPRAKRDVVARVVVATAAEADNPMFEMTVSRPTVAFDVAPSQVATTHHALHSASGGGGSSLRQPARPTAAGSFSEA